MCECNEYNVPCTLGLSLCMKLHSHNAVAMLQPTWVATGIAGESNRSFLQNFAFPVEGAGISSALNAIFRTSVDLGDALNSGQSFVANSRMLEYIPFKSSCKFNWMYSYYSSFKHCQMMSASFRLE